MSSSTPVALFQSGTVAPSGLTQVFGQRDPAESRRYRCLDAARYQANRLGSFPGSPLPVLRHLAPIVLEQVGEVLVGAPVPDDQAGIPVRTSSCRSEVLGAEHHDVVVDDETFGMAGIEVAHV